MGAVSGTVRIVVAGEARIELDVPVIGIRNVSLRDEAGLSPGDRVRIEAHPASPMGATLLLGMVPVFLLLVGIAWARATGQRHPVWIGLGMGAAGLVPMILVE